MVVALTGAHVVKLDVGVDLVVDAITVRMSLVSPGVEYIADGDE